MVLLVKRLERADAHDLKTLRVEALRLHPECFGASLSDEEQQPLSVFEARIANTIMLGAFLNDTLVGIAGLRCENAEKTAHIASVFSVFVQQKARGHGAARKLMTKLLAYAKDHRSVRLSVTAGNDAAITLYTSLGFQVWATDRDALNIGDTFYDEILMRLDR